MFRIFYAYLWLVTFLPLRVHYFFSDIFLYPFVYHILRYRRDVVFNNLRNSFPEKSAEERKTIERKFYRYLCDLIVETIYGLHISEKEIKRRIIFNNTEIVTDAYDKGKSVMLMTAHFCNWEWITSFSLHLPEGSPIYGIYKQLNNRHVDAFMIRLRQRYKGGVIETRDLYKTMLRMKNAGKLGTFGMISDQRPAPRSYRHWCQFLHQDTAVFVGTEQLAKKFDYPVVLMNCRRVKRGYYECEIVPVCLEPTASGEHEITETYMEMLEQIIYQAPEYWLWTHKRWKHKRN